MGKIDVGSLGEFLSTPLVLPVTLAGAVAALLIVLLVLALWRTRGSGAGRFLAFGALVIGILAVAALIDRMRGDEQAAERRALIARDAELARAALAPGSALSCLDALAGEAVENACEKAVFADARSTAAAVAYVAARIDLLRDVAVSAKGSGLLAEFSASRRALELDRFGVAAHVLASRDGCTADRCAAFGVFADTTALKSNLKAQVFDQYVARHAPEWRIPEAAPRAPAVSEGPTGPAASTTASAPPPPGHVPLSDKYDFPSAASIPPVSIMNAEPPLPKDGDRGSGAAAQTAGTAAPAGTAAAAGPPTPRAKPAPVQTSPAPAR
jgi:hypothetical protein